MSALQRGVPSRPTDEPNELERHAGAVRTSGQTVPVAVATHRRPWLAAPRAASFYVGAALLCGFVLAAILAPILAPYDPTAFIGRPLAPPSRQHPLGTNDAGQDILSELLYGARASLTVSLMAAAVSLGVAALVGAVAGYVGGWPDVVALRTIDVLLATPQLPLMILLAAYLPPSLPNTILVIALLGWPITARTVRSQVLTLRARDYVTAAHALGSPSTRILFRHILPALGPILTASFVALAARAASLEAGLALLGLGDPLAKSWGAVMRAALSFSGIFFTSHWLWWLAPAAACVSLLVLAITLIGAGLEERFDPQLSATVRRTRD